MNPGDVVTAVRDGNIEGLRQFLQTGGDLHADGFGELLLDFAVRHGHLEIVRLLLDSGVDPNGKSSQSREWFRPPLAVALGRCEDEIACQLVERGADTYWDPKHGSALLLATQSYCYRFALMLVARGEDVNVSGSGGRTPLIAAVINQHVELVAALLRAGAAVGHTDDQGGNALWYAGEHKEITAILKAAGDNEEKPNT